MVLQTVMHREPCRAIGPPSERHSDEDKPVIDRNRKNQNPGACDNTWNPHGWAFSPIHRRGMSPTCNSWEVVFGFLLIGLEDGRPFFTE